MNGMRICSRLVLVGMALGLALAGCGGTDGPKSNKAEITALALTIGSQDYTINFTGTTAKVVLPEGTAMPDTATVKSVTLSPGASGLAQNDPVSINNASGEASIKITAEDGTTMQDYTITVSIAKQDAKQDLSATSFSYSSAVSTTEGTSYTTAPPVWAGSPTPSGITYGITGYSGDGSLDTGVGINSGTGVITITSQAQAGNSGTYKVTATAGADSNYAAGTQLTVDVTVTIAKRNFSTVTLTYPVSTIRAVVDFPNDMGIEPAWDAETPTPAGITYSIDASATNAPATDGTEGTPVVSIDPNTGKITITDAAVVDNSGDYTVTATAGENSNYVNDSPITATVNVEITAMKANLDTTSFTYTEVKANEGTANDIGVDPAWDANSVFPVGITYDISASIGLNAPSTDGTGGTPVVEIDADGKITITADAEAAHSGDYTVTATAGANSNYSNGTTKTATVTVKVRRTLSNYSLSYPMAKHSTDGSISASPVWKKGPDDKAPSAGGVTYAISPSLPSGLILDVNSGTISGTMPSLDKVTAYQITATGDNIDYVGSTTGTFLDKFLLEEYTPDTTGEAISTVAELKAMTKDGEYYLTAHLDLSTEISWAPIASFDGKFHGNGYALYNLTIDAEAANKQGLFGTVSRATIENLSIGVTSIKGNEEVGALAGDAIEATLSNIAVAPMATDAKIEALSSKAGGLVGVMNGGSLTGYNLVSIVSGAGDKIGGLVGDNREGLVIGYATGDLTAGPPGATFEDTGGADVGGLVGLNYTGAVIGYATGAVSGVVSGGLVGTSQGGIVTGYATGAVSGVVAGGLVGNTQKAPNNNFPSITGYATGAGGGLAGSVSDSTVSGYWDKQSSGQDASEGGATVVGISATKNIVFTSGSYTDSGNNDSAIFDNTSFTAIFDTENGADKTWPKLKSSFTYDGNGYSFDFPQPMVTVSASDEDTIEVAY